MAKWCPNCHAEYVEGWETCSNCGVRLVREKPAETRYDTDYAATGTRRSVDDPFVGIWEGPTIDAEGLGVILEEAHIPVQFGEATWAGHAVVQVPQSYVQEANDVVAGRTASWPSAVDVRPTGGFDWKPGVRIALVIVAIALIVLMLIT